MKILLIILAVIFSVVVEITAQFDIPFPEVAEGRYTITDTVYMSVEGEDINPGTRDQPVRSFSQAMAILPWGTPEINGGHTFGLIRMLPGFYETTNGFHQSNSQWEKDGLFKNISIEGIGEVIIGGTRESFAENHLLRLRGDHIFIRNIKLQFTTGTGLLLNRTPRGQNNVLIENVRVDSVGIFSILVVGVDTILVRNTVSRHASRPGNDSLTTPCQWPSGIKFLDCRFATIYDSEIAHTRGEGLNFHNSVYCQAYRNILRDNNLNFYNDNSSKLQVFNNLIYNHPDTDLNFFRGCPADTLPIWSGRGILIANEGACTDGFWPSFQNCETRCVGAPRTYPNVDSMFVYNNIMLNTGRAISFWEGVTDILGHNCIRNVFIFNNTIVGAMGMPDAGSTGLVNLFFPSFNILNNGNHARLENVRIFNNIFSYEVEQWDNLLPYRENFHPLHPTPDAVNMYNNLWIREHDWFGQGDELRSSMPGFIHPEDDLQSLLTPCEENYFWVKAADIPFDFVADDYYGNNRRNDESNVGAIEYLKSCHVVATDETRESGSFVLFPNPGSNLIYLKNRAGFVDNYYELIDVSGRVQISGHLRGFSQQIDISGLSPGYYLMRIHDRPFVHLPLIKY